MRIEDENHTIAIGVYKPAPSRLKTSNTDNTTPSIPSVYNSFTNLDQRQNEISRDMKRTVALQKIRLSGRRYFLVVATSNDTF
jgi:hypothetical protein